MTRGLQEPQARCLIAVWPWTSLTTSLGCQRTNGVSPVWRQGSELDDLSSSLPDLRFVAVQFSRSVVSNGLQHTRPPCPSPVPTVNSNLRPLRPSCKIRRSLIFMQYSKRPQDGDVTPREKLCLPALYVWLPKFYNRFGNFFLKIYRKGKKFISTWKFRHRI